MNSKPEPRVVIVVPAAFRRWPGCCADTIEPGDRMARLSTGGYVHERCAP